METQAIVVKHPESGKVITKWEKDGKTYGKIRLDQSTIVVENGFTNIRKRVAFVTMDEATMAVLEPSLKDGKPYPINGKIVRKESFEPLYAGQAHKINPTTNEAVLVNGKKVYFKDDFTTNMSAQDSLISATASVATESNVESLN
jgi:hypothetical protein